MVKPYAKAYVTLLTKESYLPGTLVLHHTLRSVGSKYDLIIMAPPALSARARNLLQRRQIKVVDIHGLYPTEGVHSLSAADERFRDTWTKLRAFGLSDYERIVLLDSDMIVMRNMDELFDLELPNGWIAAAHACACNPRKLPHYPVDWIPENCAYTPLAHPDALKYPTEITPSSPRPYSLLNSGLVVLRPSTELMAGISRYLATSELVPTFSFPDQDLLAAYFNGKWKPLPWCYNALKTLRVIHKPLWRDDEIRCLHYILHDKPWHQRKLEGDHGEVNNWWWHRFDKLGEEMKNGNKQAQEDWKLLEANVVQVPSAKL